MFQRGSLIWFFANSMSQAQAERRAIQGSIRDKFERAVILCRRLTSDGQAEANTVRLGREIGVEDPLLHILRDPGTAIGKDELNKIAYPAALDGDSSLGLRHLLQPIEGVVQQIHYYRLDLHWVDRDS